MLDILNAFEYIKTQYIFYIKIRFLRHNIKNIYYFEVLIMKKIFVLFIVFNIFLISSCSGTTYLKEFPYLPAYKNMTLETTEEGAEENAEEETTEATGELTKKTYIVKNVSAENVLNEYEEILHEDGWTTTLDGKPNMIEISKDEHQAMILVYEKDDVVKLEITAK